VERSGVGEVVLKLFNRELAEKYWPELEASALDYLRRSGEELTEEEELALVQSATSEGRHDLWALGAFRGDQLVAWAIVTGHAGTAATGPTVVVWQVYVWPGRARLRDLVARAMPIIESYAQGLGASRITMHTRRLSSAYAAMMRRLGWSPYAVTWTKEVVAGGR